VKPRTGAEEYLAQRRADPEYAAAHELAARRVDMFDEVVRALDVQRDALGMTKAELARRADMPPAAVRRLFSQRHKNPTLTTLVGIAEALGLQVRIVPSSAVVAGGKTAHEGGTDPSPATERLSPTSGTRRRTA
jgi:transcriptional regulator with XRE-family HTH domain